METLDSREGLVEYFWEQSCCTAAWKRPLGESDALGNTMQPSVLWSCISRVADSANIFNFENFFFNFESLTEPGLVFFDVRFNDWRTFVATEG